MTGTKAQLYNGIALLAVFFSCRLVWGAYSSYNIYKDVWDALQLEGMSKMDTNDELMMFGTDRSLPMWLVILYMSGHVILQVLNVWWFGKMISAVKKRFTGKSSKKE
jgi:Trk-type K+ transport system membrane component